MKFGEMVAHFEEAVEDVNRELGTEIEIPREFAKGILGWLLAHGFLRPPVYETQEKWSNT